MRQFFGDGFDQPFVMPVPEKPPADDGALRRNDDLLPEERLRQQEQKPPAAGDKRGNSGARPPAPTGEIKTIRI